MWSGRHVESNAFEHLIRLIHIASKSGPDTNMRLRYVFFL